jgi:capsid protein
MIKYLAPGEGVTMSDPKASGGYAEFQRFGLRAIASGVGVPYELMTGDLSQVNYSSYRAGLVDFRRRLEQDQWHLYVPRVCDRIAGWFQEEVSNATPGMGERTEFEWTPPRFELIDPLKETQAEIEACQAGFDTWEEIVRRRGWTAEEHLDEIEEWQKELTKRGIVLKSDYRNEISAKAGQGSASAPSDGGDATDPEDGGDTTTPQPEEKMSRKIIQRDARGRISAIVETGAVVERDEQGHIKAILEVA